VFENSWVALAVALRPLLLARFDAGPEGLNVRLAHAPVLVVDHALLGPMLRSSFSAIFVIFLVGGIHFFAILQYILYTWSRFYETVSAVIDET
jgi:hypothetical protein